MRNPDTILLVLCAWPANVPHERPAESLLRDGLAACVNVVPGVESLFFWKKKLAREQETLWLLKTTEKCFPALKERLLAVHPYDLPEIIALPVEQGSQAYLDWVREETS